MRYVLAIGLIVAALFVGAWDVWVTSTGEPESTVSRTIFDWNQQFPAIVLLFGFVLGHIFWPQVVVKFVAAASVTVP